MTTLDEVTSGLDGRQLREIYRRLTIEVRVNEGGATVDRQLLPGELNEAVLRQLVPLRTVEIFTRQPTVHSWKRSSTTRRHHPVESQRERAAVVAADFDETVTWLATQSVKFSFGLPLLGKQDFIPDLIVSRSTGLTVIEVKRADTLDGDALKFFKGFDEVCTMLGLVFELQQSLPDLTETLEFLAPYARWAPSPACEEMLAPHTDWSSIADLRDVVLAERAGVAGFDAAHVLGAIYHHMAVGDLAFDERHPLNLKTNVRWIP